MVDIHSHILPGIDDGARVIEESLDMLRIASENQTDKLVLTPHMFNPRIGLVEYEKVKSSFDSLKLLAADEGIKIQLYLGCEIFCSDWFFEEIGKKEFFTLNNTDYLLLEFDFNEDAKAICNAADAVIKAGYRPIIAHPERYKYFRRDALCAQRLMNKGCIFQLNKSSLLGVHGSSAKEFSMWMLENRIASVVASDAHDTEFRAPDLEESFMWIYRFFSKTYAEDLFFNNPQAILDGKDVIVR